MRTSVLLCLAALIVIICGCPPRETDLERAIERALPGLVGPADRYEVDLEGVTGTRHARRVTATGIRVRPEGTPILDRVNLVMLDVTYDARRGELLRVGQADATVRVLDFDIAVFLEADRNLRNVSVTLASPNQATIRAQPEIPQLTLPPGVAEVVVTGDLVGEGQFVNFQVTEVRAAGVRLPSPAPRLLSEEINPVVDLTRMPLVMQVVQVRVEGNAVIAEVTGRYP